MALMFDPTGKSAEECADFLFRWNAKGILRRWWAARSSASVPAARVRELAGDVVSLLLRPDPWPNGPEVPCPYVRAQLGTALRVSKTGAAVDYDEAVRLARGDLMRA